MTGTRVADLTVQLGRTIALTNVTVAFSSGVTAVVGANGSGKSTLLRCMAGLVRPHAGSVHVAGHSLATPDGRRAARAALGYLSQRTDFPGSYTVREALRYGAWLHRVPRAERETTVRDAVERFALTDHQVAELRTLSGGTRQRVYIALASIHRPSVLMLDEPSVGLDLAQRHALREVIHRASQDSTVVVTTHDIDDLVSMADRLVVLAEGVVVFNGTVTELDATGDRSNVERQVRTLMTGAQVA